jgi:YidC/Oxa1 family membrane protein insertase
MISFFHTILYVPIYNLLIFLVGIIPHGDVGIALIGVVVVVRVLILPLSLSMVRTQKAMQVLNPEIKALQEKYKDDKETLAKETFALYKKYKLNPFASIFTLIIQLPVLITLYFIAKGSSLYVVNTALLYPFIHMPAVLSPLFLGFFVLSKSNLILAALSALSQFGYAYYGMPVPPAPPKSKDGSPASMQEEFGRAMQMQMRFVLPIIIGIVSYTSGALALYFITSNIIMVLQTVLVNFRSPSVSSATPTTTSKTKKS